ncbi:MAG: recombinase family protein [Lachnospiraceae bacterium]|nr:recombinase family protein [Lachnospiraceae bacterium]
MEAKVAIYCRLSEEDRNKQFETEDSRSIQNQKSMLLSYAFERGWEVYNIYSDDDYAGADRKRPEFIRLIEDAKARKFDIILCKSQSRFTRELEMVEKYIHGLFPIWGIRFISIVDNADTNNKGNKKSRQINGLINEWYLEDMSENIKSVLINKRKQGYYIGAFPLYGYKKDLNKKGHLLIDEEAAKVVREVFTLFSQGYGKTAIARILNDRGIPNPTEYKRQCGLRYYQPKMKNSTLWKYFNIADMLENEMYIGNMIQGKYGSVSYKTKQNKPRPKEQWYRVEGTHEAIIDRDLWNRVQTLISQKAKPFNTGMIGLFAKKVRCANCGYIMCSSVNHHKHYLKCPTRKVSKDACIGSFISVDKLEQLVVSELNKLIKEYLDRDEFERKVEFSNNLQEQKKQIMSDISNYEKKVAEYTKVMRELYLDKVKGAISESDFSDILKEFSLDKERLEKIILENKKKLDEIKVKIKVGDNRRALIEQYTNLEHLSREIVESLIDYISVGKCIPGTRNTPIEIHWNF